jgi:hypothetical protein
LDADEWHDDVLTSELGEAVHEEADLVRARVTGVTHARVEALRVQPQLEDAMHVAAAEPTHVGGTLPEPVCRWCQFEAW